MTIERTAKVNALTALLRTVDLGIDARRPLPDTKITEISHCRVRDEHLDLHTICRVPATRSAIYGLTSCHGVSKPASRNPRIVRRRGVRVGERSGA